MFWTFPAGLPGAGLLLMRLVTGGALISRLVEAWPLVLRVTTVLNVAEGIAAVLIVAGLGTAVCGPVVAVLELWRACRNPEELLVHLLLATLGAALALLGPGALSIDARIFGWRRIDVPSASKGPRADSN